jgi:hypothetical protein
MVPDSDFVQKDTETMASEESSLNRSEMNEEYNSTARKRLYYLLINSTTIFILTYLLSYLLYQLITMACAYLVGIPSVLYYYEIVFDISNYSPEWTGTRIGVTYLIAPFTFLIIGSVLLFGVIKKYNLQQYHKLFLLWLGFHMINFFFSGIFVGSITGRGIGYALDVVFWPIYFIYGILSLIAISCLVLVGYDFTEQFLKTNPSNYWSKRKNRREYLLNTLVFPLLIGSYLMFLVKFPDHRLQHEGIVIHDFILLLSMIFLIIPMFFRKKNARFHPKPVSEEKKRNIWWSMVIVTIVFLIFFRVGLTNYFYTLLN